MQMQHTRQDTPVCLRRRALLSFAACAAVSTAAAVHAAEPHFAELVLSDDDDPDGTDEVFAAAVTPQLYLFAELVGVPAGAKVRCTWLQLAPAQKKLGEQEITVAPNQQQVRFMQARPAGGWAAGAHRVELSLNGRQLSSVPFKFT